MIATAVVSLLLSQSLTNSEYGIIQGELIYPSEYTPAQ